MRTHYSVEFKLQVLTALDTNDGNIFKTAQEFGIPRSNISEWNRDREKLFIQGETLLQQNRLHLAQRMELIVNQIVDSMPGKVKQSRLADSARALSTLIALSEALTAKQEAKEAASMTNDKLLEKIMRRFGADPADYKPRRDYEDDPVSD